MGSFGDDMTDEEVLARMTDDVHMFAAMRQAKGKSRSVDAHIASTLWEHWGCERFDWFVAEMVEVLAGTGDGGGICGTGDEGGIGGTGDEGGISSTGDKGGTGSTGGKGGMGSTRDKDGIGSTCGKGGIGSKRGTGGIGSTGGKGGIGSTRDKGGIGSTGGKGSMGSTGGEGEFMDHEAWGQHGSSSSTHELGKLMLETLRAVAAYGQSDQKKRRVAESDL